MSQAAPSPPVRKRRWYQFSLRTILILSTIIALWFGWWSYRARQQKETVAALIALGGTVQYDFQQSDPNASSPYPKWLIGALGVDYFADVVGVGLIGNQVTDESLQILKRLPAIQELGLRNTNVTDAGLEHIKGLTALREIGIWNTTNVTPAGVKRLHEALPKCKIYGQRR